MSDLAQKIREYVNDYDQGDPVGGFVAAIDAVLRLHQAVEVSEWNQNGHCIECNDSGWEAALDGHSPVDWPCPTVRAIAAGLGVSVEERTDPA